MIQFIIFMTTMCPPGIQSPCWEKAHIVEQADRFDIVYQVYGTECDVKGHDWAWQFHECGTGRQCAQGMKCSRCHIDRQMIKIERQDDDMILIHEVWNDDSTEVHRPKDIIFDKNSILIPK